MDSDIGIEVEGFFECHGRLVLMFALSIIVACIKPGPVTPSVSSSVWIAIMQSKMSAPIFCLVV